MHLPELYNKTTTCVPAAEVLSLGTPLLLDGGEAVSYTITLGWGEEVLPLGTPLLLDGGKQSVTKCAKTVVMPTGTDRYAGRDSAKTTRCLLCTAVHNFIGTQF
jgi:hypothetical protein